MEGFFLGFVVVVDGDGEYFFVVVSAVAVGSSSDLGFVFYFFFFFGLWVWISDQWCGVCGCGLVVRLVDDRGLGFWLILWVWGLGASSGGRGVG